MDESASYQRSKYIDTRYHYIHDILQKGEIQVDYIPPEQNPADVLFTKALGAESHYRCVIRMGLCSIKFIVKCSNFGYIINK